METALCFGWVDGVERSIDAQRYAYRFSPQKPKSKLSALNRERAERLRRTPCNRIGCADTARATSFWCGCAMLCEFERCR